MRMFFKAADNNDKAIIAALNASQAIIEFTPRGDILTANDNFLKTVGYRLDELAGRHHSLFCDPAYAASDAYRAFWQDLAAGHFRADTFKRQGKGGRIIWLQASYNPIRNDAGKVIKVIKFATDITAQRRNELDVAGKIAAIDRSQAVIEFTPTGDILTANGNFLAAVGYELGEIAGRHHRMFCEPDYVASEAYREFWARLGRGEFQSGEFKRVGRGGREIYIQAIYSPILDDAGQVIKVVKFASDVTKMVHRRQGSERANRNFGTVVGQIFEAQEKATVASGASSETGAIINSVAAASEELSQSVRAISDNMSSARTSVEGVFKHAETANLSAETLNKSASAMNNVVTLISDIAGQINLLALNATIESARAGEAGKGFAVVASEVKSLANQAARSTQTIAGEIATMQSVTNEVVEALGLISGSMTHVLENVASVASAMEQQNSVTSEITYNMQSAVTAVREITDSLANINQTFSQVAETSENVRREMDALAA
ncbi:PAS domain-containing methyl-accepting chemotaxis protein [Asticcacaulis sp. EMRT-3]|uniref:methyl-accepting chemotaxis protein n=1 Tax=Asticcacaulis sp. EMRT-3 TaxID=3040349 RepID=UPI0024AECF32|nr:PAS domain-containing methyl-accepting chemotaxis protein [Asticcacaulis sp. EMRT-3]MDI7775480.1 PAS domain-containing methyl-accepting chemotaxis protein [Asticcacaulis sp. EMRT-3]